MSSLIVFLIGVAAGAAFSPFWMMVWNWVKGSVMSVVDATPTPTPTAKQ